MTTEILVGDDKCSFTDKTLFGVNEKFDTITDNSDIPTEQYLKASSGLASIMDCLGSGFSVPKKDIVGNIKRIEEKWKSDPAKFSTLQSIIVDLAGQDKPSKSLSDAILWLKRGLEFIATFVSNLSREYHAGGTNQGLRQTVISAYDVTLKLFHGRMTQFLFSNVSRLVPNRDDFLKALVVAEDATFDMVISDIDFFLINCTANIKRVDTMLTENSLNLGDKSS